MKRNTFYNKGSRFYQKKKAPQDKKQNKTKTTTTPKPKTSKPKPIPNHKKFVSGANKINDGHGNGQKLLFCDEMVSQNGPYSLGIDPAVRTFHAALYDIPTDNIIALYWADLRVYNSIRAPDYCEVMENVYANEPEIFLRKKCYRGIEGQMNKNPSNCCVETSYRTRFKNDNVFVVDSRRMKKYFEPISHASGRKEKKDFTCTYGRGLLKPHEKAMVNALNKAKLEYKNKLKREYGKDTRETFTKEDDLFDAIFIAFYVAEIFVLNGQMIKRRMALFVVPLAQQQRIKPKPPTKKRKLNGKNMIEPHTTTKSPRYKAKKRKYDNNNDDFIDDETTSDINDGSDSDDEDRDVIDIKSY